VQEPVIPVVHAWFIATGNRARGASKLAPPLNERASAMCRLGVCSSHTT
jgi:hypothetical protein